MPPFSSHRVLAWITLSSLQPASSLVYSTRFRIFYSPGEEGAASQCYESPSTIPYQPHVSVLFVLDSMTVALYSSPCMSTTSMIRLAFVVVDRLISARGRVRDYVSCRSTSRVSYYKYLSRPTSSVLARGRFPTCVVQRVGLVQWSNERRKCVILYNHPNGLVLIQV
jgi:hypothetical protein